MTAFRILKHKMSGLVSVTKNDVFLTIAQKLEANDIGIVVVLNESGGVAGVVSERDLVHAVAKHASAALVSCARDMMTRDVLVCAPDDTELQVMKSMLKRRVRHMPVVSEGRVIGIVSLGDAVLYRMSRLGYMGIDDTNDHRLGTLSRHLRGSGAPTRS